MAVTQISKIQVRKGRKISPVGFPQLAGGEIAWAVDSQELYIGNGSVAEGAPYVGNTKILTEHDNILALISSYKFGGNEAGSPVPFSVARSFQSKLDETVSVLDFGAVGDGVSNNVSAFETAFDQLYQNSLAIYRKTLLVPNGEYVFDSDLRVPSFVQLLGETLDGVTLRFTGDSGIKLVHFIGGAENLVEFTESQRPENITISKMTIVDSKSILSGAKNVLFENIKFRGTYQLADPSIDPSELESAVYWRNARVGVEATDIKFNNCSFENLEVAVKCDQTIIAETSVIFDNCQFKNLDTGILVLGIEDQSNKWKLNNSSFLNTANHGIYVSQGTDMLIRECSFKNCGVKLDGSMAVNSVYFGQSQNNILIDCLSDRQKDQTKGLTPGELTQVGYVPEVFGASKVTFLNRNQGNIENYPDATPIALLSSYNDYIEINYFIKLRTGDTRQGKLTISTNKEFVDENGFAEISDNFTYYSPPGLALGRQENVFLKIYSVSFGQLYKGSVISGENISQGTRIIEVNPATVNTNTGVGTYNVDRLPIVDPTTPDQITGIPINFERDIMRNLTFSARFLDNIEDSTTADTIVLEYRFSPQRTPYFGSAENISGVISFDISYGTSGV